MINFPNVFDEPQFIAFLKTVPVGDWFVFVTPWDSNEILCHVSEQDDLYTIIHYLNKFSEVNKRTIRHNDPEYLNVGYFYRCDIEVNVKKKKK